MGNLIQQSNKKKNEPIVKQIERQRAHHGSEVSSPGAERKMSTTTTKTMMMLGRALEASPTQMKDDLLQFFFLLDSCFTLCRRKIDGWNFNGRKVDPSVFWCLGAGFIFKFSKNEKRGSSAATQRPMDLCPGEC